MKQNLLLYLTIFSALFISVSAAYFSISGLSKMFIGASTQIIIMASSLELAKLIIVSVLYQHWSKIKIWLKTYLILAVVVLMGITSGGIYGYLTSAYSSTAQKLEIQNKQISLLNHKQSRYQTILDETSQEKQQINNSIVELNKGLSNNVFQYKDKETGQILNTTSSQNRKTLETQINEMKQQRDKLSVKEESLNDSITNIALLKQSIEINTNTDTDIGPLKYIASLTGKTIDVIVNWFTLAIMVVFDPLAIALVLVVNILMKKDENIPAPTPINAGDAIKTIRRGLGL